MPDGDGIAERPGFELTLPLFTAPDLAADRFQRKPNAAGTTMADNREVYGRPARRRSLALLWARSEQGHLPGIIHPQDAQQLPGLRALGHVAEAEQHALPRILLVEFGIHPVKRGLR